jgi:hypothetical protein
VINLFFSLLVGVLVAGAVFVVADRFRGLLDAGSAEFAAVPGRGSLVQAGLNNESQEQLAASNLYKQLGIKLAFGIPVLAALFYLVWSYDTLHDLLGAARERATALEDQILGPADAGLAFGSGTAAGTHILGSGQPFTETTISGSGSEMIDRTGPGYALPFRGYRWREPAERHLPDFGNRWVGQRHAGVAWQRPAPSFPTAVSRAAPSFPSAVSRGAMVGSRSQR